MRQKSALLDHRLMGDVRVPPLTPGCGLAGSTGGTCSSAPWRTPARHRSGWRRRQGDVCRVPALSVQDTLPWKLLMSSPAGRVIAMAT